MEPSILTAWIWEGEATRWHPQSGGNQTSIPTCWEQGHGLEAWQRRISREGERKGGSRGDGKRGKGSCRPWPRHKLPQEKLMVSCSIKEPQEHFPSSLGVVR